MFQRLVATTLLLLLALPGRAFASPMSPVPMGAGKGDLDEVDDLADDDILPRSTTGESEVESRVTRINRSQARELRLSHEEIRSKHAYVGSLGLGSAKPWQAYDVEVGYLFSPNRLGSFFAGGGPQHFEGVVEEKSYDMDLNARTFGSSYRYYFQTIEGMSIEGLLGYAQWDGKISPHGSDDEVTDGSEKLSSSYHATGFFGGVSTALTWLWESGFYLEWTLVGIQATKVTTMDFTRDTVIADKAVRRDLQRGSFYGLNNLKLGMCF